MIQGDLLGSSFTGFHPWIIKIMTCGSGDPERERVNFWQKNSSSEVSHWNSGSSWDILKLCVCVLNKA